jgi:hypothetical protein
MVFGRLKRPQEFGSGHSDVGSIAKNDQLYDQIVVRGEIESEHQRIRQAALVIVTLDVSRRDEVPIVVDQFGYFHRQSLADDIASTHSLIAGFPQ